MKGIKRIKKRYTIEELEAKISNLALIDMIKEDSEEYYKIKR